MHSRLKKYSVPIFIGCFGTATTFCSTSFLALLTVKVETDSFNTLRLFSLNPETAGLLLPMLFIMFSLSLAFTAALVVATWPGNGG